MNVDVPKQSKRFLFIHQNFPGQFVHLAQALAGLGHEVVALGIEGREVPGVRYGRYKPQVPKAHTAVPLLRDVEAKVVRGSACASAMLQLLKAGFVPDVVVAHLGWGEPLFCKDVWPKARLIVFAEFFYNAEGADYGFDPEFSTDTPAARSRLRMKNTALLHALHACDEAYAPTQWQHSQLPPEYRSKTRVIFDGIRTDQVTPDAKAEFQVPGTDLVLRHGDEVLTFVNRNLEPYRGFHTFMRALPAIMAARPEAQCLIVGRDELSYGSPPKGGGSWKDAMLAEVGQQLPMERVHFTGPLPYAQYLKVLQVSRCHVYLTYPFVLSWSCVEAMSAGCVVLASDTGPVREVIEHGKTGLLTSFFDAPALATQAVKVLAKPKSFAKLGVAAREQSVARYDLDHHCLPEQLRMVLGEADAN
jgi:glycosyltransferase involved in cell wall biosynthesis